MEADRLIIATGGAAILVALDKATGKDIWRTPNQRQSDDVAFERHASHAGGRETVSLRTLKGPLGVSAADGKLLWSSRASSTSPSLLPPRRGRRARLHDGQL